MLVVSPKLGADPTITTIPHHHPHTFHLPPSLPASFPFFPLSPVSNEVGGSGGSPFSSRCPAGKHVVGMSLNGGDFLDSMVLICSDNTPLGRFGGRGGAPNVLSLPAGSKGRPMPCLAESPASGA